MHATTITSATSAVWGIVLFLSAAVALEPDMCSSLVCSISTDGSGLELYNDYAITVSNNSYSAGDSISVTLHHTSCKTFSDPGPKWYVIEAVQEATGAPAGTFVTPAVADAERCRNEAAVAFKPCEPTVLDLPAKHTWTASRDTHGAVCFRVKIMPPNENDTICQTLSTCITGPLQQARNVTPTSAPISTISISTVNPSPSPERIARCMNKWSCENARLRNICVSDGHTYPTRCHMRRQECIYNVDLDVVHRGECMVSPTTSTTATTVQTTTAQPTTIGNCYRWKEVDNFGGWLSQCTCAGIYKKRQCSTNTGSLQCWCSYPDGTPIPGTRQTITCTNDLDPYDLNCS